MSIEDLIILGNEYLHKDEVKLILSTLLSMNPLELNLNLEKQVDEETVLKYKKVLKYKREGMPIQYALNNACFYGYDFYVSEDVLIPRFETEELVYNTIIYLKKYFNSPKVLDLCSGSGCIGITLKKECPDISIDFADISTKALDVLKKNLKGHQLDGKVIESDLFANIHDKYDIIVSNPPYVAYSDKVDEIVQKYEPSLALYADNNGLEMYERILKDASKYLKDKFLIAFEIGSTQARDVIALIQKYLTDVKVILKKDASARDRMIFIFKNIDFNE